MFCSPLKQGRRFVRVKRNKSVIDYSGNKGSASSLSSQDSPFSLEEEDNNGYGRSIHSHLGTH